MSEHVITENLKQENGHNSGELVCSCGLSASITHNKRTSLTIARARLRKMHEANPADNGGEVCGPKKEKAKKPIDDPTIQESEDAWEEAERHETKEE